MHLVYCMLLKIGLYCQHFMSISQLENVDAFNILPAIAVLIPGKKRLTVAHIEAFQETPVWFTILTRLLYQENKSYQSADLTSSQVLSLLVWCHTSNEKKNYQKGFFNDKGVFRMSWSFKTNWSTQSRDIQNNTPIENPFIDTKVCIDFICLSSTSITFAPQRLWSYMSPEKLAFSFSNHQQQ